jgi:hypothetical protein
VQWHKQQWVLHLCSTDASVCIDDDDDDDVAAVRVLSADIDC